MARCGGSMASNTGTATASRWRHSTFPTRRTSRASRRPRCVPESSTARGPSTSSPSSPEIAKLLVLLVLGGLAAPAEAQLTRSELVRLERERVLSAALPYLREAPVTVTAFSAPRSAGGPHDFSSEGDYWWPDPKSPDGPYIRRDGETNPDNFVAHRDAMRRLSQVVPALVAAYQLTGDARYARHAVDHLRAWFVNESTRMNPNLRYAQAIKGHVTGRGIGIIDTIHLVEVAQAILVLSEMGYLREQPLGEIKSWFRQYLTWLTTDQYGLDERNNGNNHSVSWALQVAELARLVNDERQEAAMRTFFKDTLLPQQMAPDGSFPRELART